MKIGNFSRTGAKPFRAATALMAFWATSPLQAAVGTTAGSFGVTPTGAAAYSIPIVLPPGPNGLQPSLALGYSSQGSAGRLGAGWALSGLSAIARCPQTVSQNGVAVEVKLITSDGYCLDGNQLRLTSGTYGLATSTYQTEIADFSTITAMGSAGNGPSYFLVKQKDGATYEYGATADSKVLIASSNATPYQWLLDKVTDRFGNTYVISYTHGPGGNFETWVPDLIQYTPSSYGASTYNYRVKFNYTTRVAQYPTSTRTAITGFLAGYPITDANLLTSIQLFTGGNPGTLYHSYTLAYDNSPSTTEPRLTSVTECAGSGATDCLPPTTFTYQAGSTGVNGASTVAVSGNWAVVAARDFDGDGRDDLLIKNPSTNALSIAFATATGYAAPVSLGATWNGNPPGI